MLKSLPCDDGEFKKESMLVSAALMLKLPGDDGQFTKESILVSAALELE
ncbi:Uncharacterized protein APZ42_004036 [Daphnia magna]|uniref:Uncharacterized protein n=1 Tax=Daphnia magna TaxID=35525 RepID=A0A164HAF2_9CRUS|nr:Uncharacterized protein APZ42_004036 [Daphnia magna]